jgi:hypothetical protein
VLRSLFGLKTKEVVGGKRRLHNEELHNLYVSPNIIRVITSIWMRWGEACSTHVRDEKCTEYFGRKI